MQHLKNDDSVCILTAQSKAYNNLDRLQGKYSRGTILNENKANPVWFYFFFNILKIRGIGGCGHKVWQQRVLKIWNRYILMVAAVTWSYNVIKLHRTHTHTHECIFGDLWISSVDCWDIKSLILVLHNSYARCQYQGRQDERFLTLFCIFICNFFDSIKVKISKSLTRYSKKYKQASNSIDFLDFSQTRKLHICLISPSLSSIFVTFLT
jgi:hypothetical protein